MDLTKFNLQSEQLEELYIKAKKSYYLGEPILSDTEFDQLESYLDSEGRLDKIVGFEDEDRNAKFKHPSKMLSLGKFQAAADGTPPTNPANKWLSKRKDSIFEATPKFDGNAINVIYRKGKLDAILSRGNGTAGRDYTDKLKANVPSQISTEYDIVEVRGEVVIATKVFNAKYSQFKNERNFVAGILNRDEDVTSTTADFTFMAVEARGYINDTQNHLETDILEEFGFNNDYDLFVYRFNHEKFETAYDVLLQYRLTAPFRLDGFVIKTETFMRHQLGENSHDPNWAIAIKFPPEEAVTTINKIQWNFGKTGQLTPVAILEPTLLDGTTVQRASVHNYGWMLKKGCVPGAIVKIAKKGDIIPQIIDIKQPSADKFEAPTHCPKCESELEVINGLHLQCTNDDCGGIEFKKFLHSFNMLSVDGTGGKLIKKVYEAGFTNIMDVLSENFTIDNLTDDSDLKEGKTLQRMFEQVKNIKSIHLRTVIKFMGIDNLGNSVSKQVANKIAGIDYSFSSLQKSLCTGWEIGEERYTQLMEMVQKLESYGISVEYPEAEVISEDTIKYEMTGSPKSFGFATKKEFTDYASSKGWVHTKLNEATCLITDDLNSSSSKMKTAEKKGIKIVTYDQV